MDNSIIFIEKQVYKTVTHFGGQIPMGFEVFLRGYRCHIIRRAIKLRLLNLLNQPSNATPKLILMDILKIKSPNEKDIREIAYHKAMRPSDALMARESIKRGLNRFVSE